MGKSVGLTTPGQRFGKWTVIGLAGMDNNSHKLWNCKCDCGSFREVRDSSLKNGASKSCGCSTGIPRSKHRASDTRLYKIWHNMMDRCNNVNNLHYKDYGGRGIKVCSTWSNSFPAFQKWALSNGYQEDLTIDRINVNGNYSSRNCRWATLKEQGSNRRNTIFFEIDGICKTPSQWAEDTGIPRQTIYARWQRGDIGLDIIRPIGSKASQPSNEFYTRRNITKKKEQKQ